MLMDQETNLLNFSDNKAGLRWVGIGSSAGGLDALIQFVNYLDPDDNLTYIITQHCAPDVKTALQKILQQETKLIVKEIQNNIVPKAGEIYITPAGKDLYIQEKKLLLIEPASRIAPKPSIDLFLTSLASEIGHSSIGIIFSGTGSDGSEGIRSIRDVGGITIAQNENTSKCFAMPNAAIETGCVDMILSPEEAALKLPKLLKNSKPLVELNKNKSLEYVYNKILNKLYKYSGIDFSQYKKGSIYNKIIWRTKHLGLKDIKEYKDHLYSNVKESRILFSNLLITLTSFFRDKDTFAALKETIEKQESLESLKIWVPACSSGEEAYSIAIMIAEIIGKEDFLKRRIIIYASDIDKNSLDIAKKATYSVDKLNLIDDNIIRNYFDFENDLATVKDFIRKKVVFIKHNILDSPPVSSINIISCRNLLIYFDINVRDKILQNIFNVLSPDGILFLGKTEFISEKNIFFTAIDHINKIYKKNNDTKLKGNLSDIDLDSYLTKHRKIFQDKNKIEHNVISELIITSLFPCGILCDSNFKINHIYGDVRKFFLTENAMIDLVSNKIINTEIIEATKSFDKKNNEPLQIMLENFGQKVKIMIFPLSLKKEKFFLLTFSNLEND